MEEIKDYLKKIEKISEDLDSLKVEFEDFRKRYNYLETRIRDLYIERQKLIKELMRICEQ